MAKINSETRKLGVLILAAGLGKRMQSPLPKALQPIGGQPLIFHTLDRILEGTPENTRIGIVVGHGHQEVESAILAESRFSSLKIDFIQQREQKGTGHAARCAMDSLWGQQLIEEKAEILVLPGDFPLLSTALIETMVEPLTPKQKMRLLTCILTDPCGYGQLLEKANPGLYCESSKKKDATTKEKLIKEVATAIYHFDARFLQSAVTRLKSNNKQGEYYLTDTVEAAAKIKTKTKKTESIDILIWPHSEDLRGVNNLWELAQAARVLNERTLKQWSIQGVRFIDPWNTTVDVSVELSPGTVIYPGAVLQGKTRIGKDVTVGPHVVLKNTVVEQAAHIKTGTMAENSTIREGAQLRPIRPSSTGFCCRQGGENRKFCRAQESKNWRQHQHCPPFLFQRCGRWPECEYWLWLCNL